MTKILLLLHCWMHILNIVSSFIIFFFSFSWGGPNDTLTPPFWLMGGPWPGGIPPMCAYDCNITLIILQFRENTHLYVLQAVSRCRNQSFRSHYGDNNNGAHFYHFISIATTNNCSYSVLRVLEIFFHSFPMLIAVSWLHCCIKSWGGLCILCPPHLQSWGGQVHHVPPPQRRPCA